MDSSYGLSGKAGGVTHVLDILGWETFLKSRCDG
jgi:hypothetical protein